MIDIISHVASLLTPLGAQIEQSYSDTRVKLPLIVLGEVSDSAVTSGCREVFTRITVQVDVYTFDKDETFALADKADEIMTANGFTRTSKRPFREGDFERLMMQYSCAVDYSHKRIMI